MMPLTTVFSVCNTLVSSTFLFEFNFLCFHVCFFFVELANYSIVVLIELKYFPLFNHFYLVNIMNHNMFSMYKISLEILAIEFAVML